MSGPAEPPPPIGPPGPAPGGTGPDGPGGYDGRSERRSSRHDIGRRHRSDRLGRGILPAFLAIVVVVAVMVLWSPLAPELGQSPSAQGSTTTAAATVSSAGPSATVTTGGPLTTSGPGTTSGPATTTAIAGTPASTPGSALLVVKQDGNVALVALLCAGAKGGVVLGLPGITLLRSGDRFVRLAQAYSPDSPATLAQPVADALAVPLGAVAAIEWSDLRVALTGAAGDFKLPEGLDPQGADAGAVSAVLAALLNAGNGAGAAGSWWGQAALTGEVDGFRAAVNAEITSAAGKPWAGQALIGTVVDYGAGATYLEPDLQKAIGVLSETRPGN
jgi:hypothetical protein